MKKHKEWQKKTCSWWPLGLGMRLHCENIIKNGLFWPFFHFKLLQDLSKMTKKCAFFWSRSCRGGQKSKKSTCRGVLTPKCLISFFTYKQEQIASGQSQKG